MEKIKTLTLLLFFSLFLTLQAQDYFSALNLDPTLIQQTNFAINTLKQSLYQNFDCDPNQFLPFTQNIATSTITQPFDSNLFPATQGYQNFHFTGITGFSGGYMGASPQIINRNPMQRNKALLLIYQQIATVVTLLQTIKSYLIEYNNIIIGSNNTVIGNDNFVVGSNDNLVGNNNWVFASDYQSVDPQNGVLVIELYLIELANLPQITYNPSKVVHCVNQEESNRQFINFWAQASKNRRLSL